jgi:hypothetical protein
MDRTVDSGRDLSERSVSSVFRWKTIAYKARAVHRPLRLVL